MGKTYSKAELENKAKTIFKDYPNADEVFATTDGNIFLSKNRANLHAGEKGKVISIANPNIGAADNSEGKPASSDELIEAAKTLSLEDAEAALATEEAGKSRKTVVAAYNARIEELKTDD